MVTLSSVNPRHAWRWAIINQLAFPGLGTILAGRPIGYIQAMIMVSGFCLTMGFMVTYFKAIVTVATDGNASEHMFRAAYEPHLWAVKWGLILCALAWLWAGISTVTILRDGTKAQLPPPLPPR